MTRIRLSDICFTSSALWLLLHVLVWVSLIMWDGQKPITRISRWKFNFKEQSGTNVFAETGNAKVPSIQVSSNPLYIQARLCEMVSAFLLMGKDCSDCVEFLLTVFGSSFTGTKAETLPKKLIGDKKIHGIIFRKEFDELG